MPFQNLPPPFSMASRADRKSPGVTSVFIGAVLSVIVGGLLAAVHLVSLPVEMLKTAPKEAPAKGARIFIAGESGASAGRAWQPKRDGLAAGTSGRQTWSEAELNAWSAATFEPAKLNKDDAADKMVLVTGGIPDFRFDGAALQLGMVNKVHLLGSETPLVLQARGGFVRTNAGWIYAPTEARLGALPLHKIPTLMSLVAGRFVARPFPAEVEKALQNAHEIAVREGALVIALP